MSKKVKVDPNKKEFLVLKFKELNISLSKFYRIYNVERIRRGSDIRKYLHLKFLAIKGVASSNNYSIKVLCEILKVNRKSYYKWIKRIPSKREIENETIKEKILEIQNRVEGIYGFRRMTMNINRELNKKYNCKKIHRLMKSELKFLA